MFDFEDVSDCSQDYRDDYFDTTEYERYIYGLED